MNREEAVKQLLGRNVSEVIDREHLERRLLNGEKLRVKLGIDPTSPDLHLGHAVVLRKLREFQKLKCKAVFIIGYFTARIGDPSGRDKTRPQLTEEEIKANMEKYLTQAGKIIDIKQAEVVWNGEWFGGNPALILGLMSRVSVQQILERDDFQKRLKEKKEITVLEEIYPMLQGYDSVEVKADVEIGGTDQKFNLFMGRRIQRSFGMQEQDVLTTVLLEGTDGAQKMSKSLGNYIALDDEPNEMFGKVMSLPDKLVEKYFMLCTDLEDIEIKKLKKELKPKELKERLGIEITKIYHGDDKAKKAQQNFEKLFSRGEIPEDISELKVGDREVSALELVVMSGISKSKSEAHRLIEQGGFEIDKRVIRDPIEKINLRGGEVVRIGKKNFFRIKA